MPELTTYQREEYRKLGELREKVEKAFNEQGLWGKPEWAETQKVLDELERMATE